MKLHLFQTTGGDTATIRGFARFRGSAGPSLAPQRRHNPRHG